MTSSMLLILLVQVTIWAHLAHTSHAFLMIGSSCRTNTRTFSSPASAIIVWSTISDGDSDPLEELEMIDIKEGTGEIAKFESIVTIQYTGKLLEEDEPFDESMISFKLGYGKVLDGCDRGIRGMKVGGTRILKVPSKLGFGPAGFIGPEPYSVPPNADLEYTVELTAVASGPMAEAAANMGIGLDPNTVYLK